MGFHSQFSADGVFSVVGNIYGDVCVYYCLVHVSVCEGGRGGGGVTMYQGMVHGGGCLLT